MEQNRSSIRPSVETISYEDARILEAERRVEAIRQWAEERAREVAAELESVRAQARERERDALRKLAEVRRWADDREYAESGTDRLYAILEDRDRRVTGSGAGAGE